MREIYEVMIGNLWATLVMAVLIGLVGILNGRIFFYQSDGQKSLARFRRLFLRVLSCSLAILVACVWVGTATFVSAAVLSAIFVSLVSVGCTYASWYAHVAYYTVRSVGPIG